MKQGPELRITSQNDMTATAAITTIGSRMVVIFGLCKMHAACPTLSGAAEDPDVINKVFHNWYICPSNAPAGACPESCQAVHGPQFPVAKMR